MAHIGSMRTKKRAGSWSIDFVRISQKATAGRFLRRLLNLNTHNHNQRDRRRRFYLAVQFERSKSTPRYYISLLRTLLRTSAGLRFLRTPIAHRCIGQRPPNRRAPVCKQCAPQATR